MLNLHRDKKLYEDDTILENLVFLDEGPVQRLGGAGM